MRSKDVEEAINNLKDKSNSYHNILKQVHAEKIEAFKTEIAIDIVLNYISELEKENELYKLQTGEPPLYESEIVSKQVILDRIKELENIKLCGGDVLQAVTEDQIKLLQEILNKGE